MSITTAIRISLTAMCADAVPAHVLVFLRGKLPRNSSWVRQFAALPRRS